MFFLVGCKPQVLPSLQKLYPVSIFCIVSAFKHRCFMFCFWIKDNDLFKPSLNVMNCEQKLLQDKEMTSEEKLIF